MNPNEYGSLFYFFKLFWKGKGGIRDFGYNYEGGLYTAFYGIHIIQDSHDSNVIFFKLYGIEETVIGPSVSESRSPSSKLR